MTKDWDIGGQAYSSYEGWDENPLKCITEIISTFS